MSPFNPHQPDHTQQSHAGVPIAHNRAAWAGTDKEAEAVLQWAQQTLRPQILQQLTQMVGGNKTRLNQFLQIVGAAIAVEVGQEVESRNQGAVQMAPLTPQDIGIVQDAPEVAALSLVPSAGGFRDVAPMVMSGQQTFVNPVEQVGQDLKPE